MHKPYEKWYYVSSTHNIVHFLNIPKWRSTCMHDARRAAPRRAVEDIEARLNKPANIPSHILYTSPRAILLPASAIYVLRYRWSRQPPLGITWNIEGSRRRQDLGPRQFRRRVSSNKDTLKGRSGAPPARPGSRRRRQAVHEVLPCSLFRTREARVSQYNRRPHTHAQTQTHTHTHRQTAAPRCECCL